MCGSIPTATANTSILARGASAAPAADQAVQGSFASGQPVTLIKSATTGAFRLVPPTGRPELVNVAGAAVADAARYFDAQGIDVTDQLMASGAASAEAFFATRGQAAPHLAAAPAATGLGTAGGGPAGSVTADLVKRLNDAVALLGQTVASLRGGSSGGGPIQAPPGSPARA